MLVYKNHKLAVIEAKAWDEPLTAGVAQAKNYAGKLAIRFAYATKGKGLYGIDMQTAAEGETAYPPPDELWAKTFAVENAWRNRFATIPAPGKSGTYRSCHSPVAFQFIVTSASLVTQLRAPIRTPV